MASLAMLILRAMECNIRTHLDGVGEYQCVEFMLDLSSGQGPCGMVH